MTDAAEAPAPLLPGADEAPTPPAASPTGDEASAPTTGGTLPPDGAYPALIEIARRLEAFFGGRVSGTPTEVIDAACKELNISTEGINIVERAHRAHDQLYGAPTQVTVAEAHLDIGGGDSFEGVERVDMAARKQQADRELRFDDENDGNESPAIEEETSPTALQVDGGRVLANSSRVGELTRELFVAIRAHHKDRVQELLEMGAEVNAYEPMPNGNFTPFVVVRARRAARSFRSRATESARASLPLARRHGDDRCAVGSSRSWERSSSSYRSVSSD